MERRKRRKFTTEFRAAAVRLVREGTKSLPQVAKDLDLTEPALRIWVRRAEVAEGKGPAGALGPVEREELERLRKEALLHDLWVARGRRDPRDGSQG